MNEVEKKKRTSRIFVVLFMLVAILSAIYASFVFKEMIDNRDLQERLDEVRQNR